MEVQEYIDLSTDGSPPPAPSCVTNGDTIRRQMSVANNFDETALITVGMASPALATVGLEEVREIMDTASLREEYIKVKIALAQVTKEKAAIIDALREFGMCGICQGVMQSPVILECGHAFCQKCLSAQLKHQRRMAVKYESHFPCGRCRTLIPRAVEPAKIYGLPDVLKMLPI
ncbi:hypothetical protein HYPSUDRAFT_202442 [Hypholoma sublateritium FD-334 SS-4]|uniref:RING-type domain-containing protein n=1 Tax=Hypholoma sublateritium (strain FD-334 SS-4) TaxID=945553 RepID=A0A0D2L5T7_HYPSF|nr:hypothetical protein HYPSUDRAFT_202442 [Hypholoma sublateritium FD-334 SS-4]